MPVVAGGHDDMYGLPHAMAFAKSAGLTVFICTCVELSGTCALLPGQHPTDRPDLIARYFSSQVHELIEVQNRTKIVLESDQNPTGILPGSDCNPTRIRLESYQNPVRILPESLRILPESFPNPARILPESYPNPPSNSARILPET